MAPRAGPRREGQERQSDGYVRGRSGCHGLQGAGTRADDRPRHGGVRHADEVDVPREHEPRDPHADERGHRAVSPGAQDGPQPKQRDYVAKIHTAGTSLLGIINDILDYSKIEAGKLEIETTSFRLDDVIVGHHAHGQKANERGLEFLARVSPGITQVLLGDPIRLGQILTNLVNNAIKFTEQGEFTSRRVLERTDGKCKLKFSVRDTGVGMTREQSERLFQPFTQADMSTTRRYGGTGLGLSISRRLVELMGGEIWLESELGVGSTFTFTVWLGVGEAKDPGRWSPEGWRAARSSWTTTPPRGRSSTTCSRAW